MVLTENYGLSLSDTGIIVCQSDSKWGNYQKREGIKWIANLWLRNQSEIIIRGKESIEHSFISGGGGGEEGVKKKKNFVGSSK